MNVDLILWQSCVCVVPPRPPGSRSFSFDQKMRILKTSKDYFPHTALVRHWRLDCPSYHVVILSLVWGFLVIGVRPTVLKFYFFLERKKNNWVFLYWKTIFHFAKEDLMWWFWVPTPSLQLSRSFRATGNVRDIKMTLKVLMI